MWSSAWSVELRKHVLPRLLRPAPTGYLRAQVTEVSTGGKREEPPARVCEGVEAEEDGDGCTAFEVDATGEAAVLDGVPLTLGVPYGSSRPGQCACRARETRCQHGGIQAHVDVDGLVRQPVIKTARSGGDKLDGVLEEAGEGKRTARLERAVQLVGGIALGAREGVRGHVIRVEGVYRLRWTLCCDSHCESARTRCQQQADAREKAARCRQCARARAARLQCLNRQ